MKPQQKQLYINTGFAAVLFVLSAAFLNNNFPQHVTMLTGSTITIIGAIIVFAVFMLLRNQNLIIKISFLVVYIAVITVFTHYKKNKVPIDIFAVHEKQMLKGNWVTHADNLTVQWCINDTMLKMMVDSANQQGTFGYTVHGDSVSCFNIKQKMFFDFEILKLTQDTLTTLGDKGIQNYVREK